MYSVNSMYNVRTNNITQFLPKETSLGYILHIDILVMQLQLKKLNVTVICCHTLEILSVVSLSFSFYRVSFTTVLL